MPLSVVCWRKQWPDPFGGDWCVDVNKMKVWVDASSVATEVALGVNGSIVEDACWLHSINDARHINLAKLDAVIKGVNLTLTSVACSHRFSMHASVGVYHPNREGACKHQRQLVRCW